MMRMMKSMVAIFAASILGGSAAIAGDSAPFRLDTREGVRTARAVEMIAYSPCWNGAASCSVSEAWSQDGQQTDNSLVRVVIDATDEGTFNWSPNKGPGIYTLTHTAGGETLTAQFKVLTLEPKSVDWLNGTISLVLGNASDLNGGKMISIWCRRGDNATAEWEKIKQSDGVVSLEWLNEDQLQIVDTTFSSRYDGIPPVEYRVTDEYGREAECTTRVKYAISVGVDKFAPGKGCEDLNGMENFAEDFKELAMKAGATKDCVTALTGQKANLENLDKLFRYIRDDAKPGDVCLLYFGTHGGRDKFTGYNLALYGKDEDYSTAQAFEHVSSLSKNDVAVVGIVHACGSGGFAIGDQWMQNVAWITSNDSPHDRTFGTHFSKFLLGYGWRDGWAGTSGKKLTFGHLAEYMGKSYDKFFSGLVMDGNVGEIKTKVCNKGLLDKIGAGICTGHSGESPAEFNVVASKDNPNGVTLDGFAIPLTTEIFVFRRFAFDSEKFSIVKYLGYSDKERENLIKIVVDDVPEASRYYPMEFIVKAYNGAGVAAAKPATGRIAASVAQTTDGRRWEYGAVNGGATIASVMDDLSAQAKPKGAVVLPSTLEGLSVVSVSALAFAGCDEITSITIPDSVAAIGNSAFSGCSALTEVVCEGNAPSVGDSTFNGINSECILKVSRDSTGWGVNVPGIWNGMRIEYVDDEQEPTPGTESDPVDPIFTIINGVLSSVDLNGASNVAIPDGVTSIGERVFYGCDGLTSVTIPSSVTSIGHEAFCWCSELTNIVFKGDAPILGYDVFYQLFNCVVSVERDSDGWGVDVPGTWNGMPIGYIGYDGTLATVIFDGNDGLSDSKIVWSGCPIGDLPYSYLDGFSFDGWYTSANGGELVDESWIVPEDGVTLYAHWGTPRKWYKSASTAIAAAKRTGKLIFFLAGDDNNCTSSTLGACEDFKARKALKEYVLWYCDCKKQKQDYLRYASKTKLSYIALPFACIIDSENPNEYLAWSQDRLNEDDVIALLGKAVKTVSFNPNGGDVVENERNVPKNREIGALPTPKRGKWKFAGWYTKKSGGTKITSKTKITANVTYYAHWSTPYIVTLDANGGVLNSETNTIIVMRDKAVGTLPKAMKSGYSFKGWYTKKSKGSKISAKTKIKKNITYYAQWTAKKYTVTLKKSGSGKVSGGGKKAYKSKITLKATASKGYVFSGWYLDGVLKSKKATWKTTVPLNGATYTAVFTKKTANRTSAANRTVEKPANAVVAFPAWAVGTFKGKGTFDGKDADVTLTVGKTGKISGKFVSGGKAYAFTAASFEEYGDDGILRTSKGTMKVGDQTYKVEVAVGEANAESAGATIGVVEIAVLNGEVEIAVGVVSG